MRLAAQERRREGNEPQKTKVAHHAAYPWHEVFEVEIKDEDADAVGTSPESSEVVEFGVMPAVSRLQPSDVGLDGVGGAAGGVPGAEGMEVEVMKMAYEDLVKQRTRAVNNAFEAIDAARGILSQLETLTVRTAEGETPDLGGVAGLTHALREKVDRVLVGLTEAQLPPEVFGERNGG